MEVPIEAYRSALDEWQSSVPAEHADVILRVLLARDDAANALVAGEPQAPESFRALAELDERLRGLAPVVIAGVGRAVLVGWRETRNPSSAAWWWSLDLLVPQIDRPPSALWAVLAGFCFTISVSLIADISRRFLTGGPDFVGVFSTLSQAFLALLAGSAFVQAGKGWLDAALTGLGIAPHRHHRWKAGLALLILAAILGLRLSLPGIARAYNDRGVEMQADGMVTSAIDSYSRALELNPDFAQAHYNLAAAYEDILDFDAALGEYQKAIRANPKLYAAQVNLARLYNLRKRDYASALSLLNAALKLEPSAADTQYSLYKNRGWAHFGLKLYGLAEADLRRALKLRPDGAAAHCLLAQVQETEGRREAALTAWGDCLAFDAPGEGVEADWHATAQERLAGEVTR